MSAPIVQVEHVTKTFHLRANRSVKEAAIGRLRGQDSTTSFKALDDITLDIPSGETLGLVGHNGSGKSTLLKIMGGILEPTSGRARRRGRLAALLELGAGFHPDLTGRENIFLNAAILGLTRAETQRLMDSIIDFAEIEDFIDTQVKFYSSGMYVRLGFAVAIHTDPDLLLVDEVLAVGDEPFQRKCMRRISEFQREGRTIVLVTHSASQVRELCTNVAVLDHGRMMFHGPTGEGLDVLKTLYTERRMERGISVHASDASVHFSRVTPIIEKNDHGYIDLTIEMDVELREELDGWGVKAVLFNRAGTAVTETDNFRANVALPSAPGSYVLRYEYKDIPIARGSYDLHLLACPVSGFPVYADVPQAAIVDIPSTGRGEGLVYADAAITVEKR